MMSWMRKDGSEKIDVKRHQWRNDRSLSRALIDHSACAAAIYGPSRQRTLILRALWVAGLRLYNRLCDRQHFDPPSFRSSIKPIRFRCNSNGSASSNKVSSWRDVTVLSRRAVSVAGQATHPARRRQTVHTRYIRQTTTTDDSVQNNTDPLGGPVIMRILYTGCDGFGTVSISTIYLHHLDPPDELDPSLSLSVRLRHSGLPLSDRASRPRCSSGHTCNIYSQRDCS